jgi:large subunit ribosomal protein L25
MISLSAKKREKFGKESRREDNLPGVLYGPEVKNQPLEVNLKEFRKVYRDAGGSSLIALDLGGKKFLVLIHDVSKDSVSDEFIHVDFYQPILTKEVEAEVPLVFIGEGLAVKELGGTLVKEFQSVRVKALPQDLPHEITINVEGLMTFEDEIKVKDIILPKGVRIEKNPEDTVAKAVPPVKIEEELEKPIEEDVEGVEKIEKGKKEGEEAVAESVENVEKKEK